MLFDNENDDLKNKRLCFRCVGEDFLKRDMQVNGKRRKCSYCGKVGKSYSIGEMSEQIETAFAEHCNRTSDQPTHFDYAMLADKESNYVWYRDGEEVVYAIMNAADIPEEAASDIQQILDEKFGDFESATMGEETEFARESHYEGKGPDDSYWQVEWRQLEQSLKSQARFFNHLAAQHLTTIFEGLDTMRDLDGRPMIIDAGPSTSLVALYRARVFQSDESLEAALRKPDQHIGSPPSADANAGRMNAKGISVFYGSNNPVTALAEIRPPVGSKVVVARFEIIRPIRLLDLTALENVTTGGSIFDPVFNRRLEKTMFLRRLSKRITEPVMPDDEAFEYLPTQAIADFLANEAATNIDGIVFPSVQTAGKALNVVLFHKAARVEEIDFPAGTEVHVSLGSMGEDGWEVDYSIIEWVTPKKDEPGKMPQLPSSVHTDLYDLNDIEVLDDLNCGIREKTLKIDLKTLKVHAVKAVNFTTDEHSVSHYQWEKHEDKF